AVDDPLAVRHPSSRRYEAGVLEHEGLAGIVEAADDFGKHRRVAGAVGHIGDTEGARDPTLGKHVRFNLNVKQPAGTTNRGPAVGVAAYAAKVVRPPRLALCRG